MVLQLIFTVLSSSTFATRKKHAPTIIMIFFLKSY